MLTFIDLRWNYLTTQRSRLEFLINTVYRLQVRLIVIFATINRVLVLIYNIVILLHYACDVIYSMDFEFGSTGPRRFIRSYRAAGTIRNY